MRNTNTRTTNTRITKMVDMNEQLFQITSGYLIEEYQDLLQSVECPEDIFEQLNCLHLCGVI